MPCYLVENRVATHHHHDLIDCECVVRAPDDVFSMRRASFSFLRLLAYYCSTVQYSVCLFYTLFHTQAALHIYKLENYIKAFYLTLVYIDASER
jgi:hypothetical protein